MAFFDDADDHQCVIIAQCLIANGKASETIKNVLSCASTIVYGVNDLRNSLALGMEKKTTLKGCRRDICDWLSVYLKQ